MSYESYEQFFKHSEKSFESNKSWQFGIVQCSWHACKTQTRSKEYYIIAIALKIQ